MTTWSLDARLCASPLQQPQVVPSPTCSLSSYNSDESFASHSSIASSQTSIASSYTWSDDSVSSQNYGKLCANFDAAALARQRSQADYRRACLRPASQREDSWPAERTARSVTPSQAAVTHPRRSQFRPERAKPTLVRQSDRREDFVEYLVDTATQMVAVIWPASADVSNNQTFQARNSVLPLRIFIKETLRRSRTSYSTLQVAMYYLILIKSKARLPRCDFANDSSLDSTQHRVTQCGRRMFLAALILASKYLQDRNYSARAWSKISGLKINEINSNELSFLAAVEWKLHIPEETFLRWTDIVTTYTTSMHNFGPRAGLTKSITNSWISLVKRLTPALEFTQTTWTKPASVLQPWPGVDFSQDRPNTAISRATSVSGSRRTASSEDRKQVTKSGMPPTPLLNSHLTTPGSTPSSMIPETPAEAWVSSFQCSGTAKDTQLDIQAAGCRTPYCLTATRPSDLTLDRSVFPTCQLASPPYPHSKEASGNNISVIDRIANRPTDATDRGIASLLEAAKEIGWSSDEGSIEVVKESPLLSPSTHQRSLRVSPHLGNRRLPTPPLSEESQSSDEGDMNVSVSSKIEARSTSGFALPLLTPSSMRKLSHRKRRLVVSVDLTAPDLPLQERFSQHGLANGHFSESDDLIMTDDSEPEAVSIASGHRHLVDQAGGRLSCSRVPVQRSLSGRKRICC